MNIENCRNEIDALDSQIVKLVCKRMDCAKSIAEYKKENNLKIYDSERERLLFDRVEGEAMPPYGDYIRRLYGSVTAISRAYQKSLVSEESEIVQNIEKAIKSTPKMFPSGAAVACQGIEGAYSSQACQSIFEKPVIMYCRDFESVFKAVEGGMCSYGIVPLENSTAGSVNRTYSLMKKYNFSIVLSTKMHICHSLLTKKGARLCDIKEIYSHPQAIEQCSAFLSAFGSDVKIIPCENTAIAAKKTADSNGQSCAAIASEKCAEQYDLSAIKRDISNSQNNYTRFICFSKNTQIFPGSDRTSLLIRTENKPGALYGVMSDFYALGINIIKLESRPVSGSDFEFMFYFDVSVNVHSPKFLQMIKAVINTIGEDNFKYLGSYREV